MFNISILVRNFTAEFTFWQLHSSLHSIEAYLPLSPVPIKPISSLLYGNYCSIGVEELPNSAGLATLSIVGSAGKGIFCFSYLLYRYLTVVGVSYSPKGKIKRVTCR